MTVPTPTLAEAQSTCALLRDSILEATRYLRQIEHEPSANPAYQQQIERSRADLSRQIADLEVAYDQARSDAQQAFMAYHQERQDRAALQGRIRSRTEAHQRYLMDTPESKWPPEDWYVLR